MVKSELGRHAGNFNVSSSQTVYGELNIAGSKSSLQLHSPSFFPTHVLPNKCITGVLHNLTKVSLVDCVTPGAPGHKDSPKGTYYFAKVFAHFIILGDQFIDPQLPEVLNVTVYLDDATTLFNDTAAFGELFLDAEPVVNRILEEKSYLSNRRTGPNARLVYYTGADEIVRVDSTIGRFVVEHRPSFAAGRRREGGILKDNVAVSLVFDAPLLLAEAIRRIQKAIDYLGLIVGRPQNIMELYIGTQESLAAQTLLSVYWISKQRRSEAIGSDRPSAFDVLLDGVDDPIEFASVMSNRIARSEPWHDARWRFFNSFSNGAHYDINRLIASANMFDVLPPSAIPLSNPLEPNLLNARKISRDIFRALPTSPERESVLNCLGRLGSITLKRKIRYRAQKLIDQCEGSFVDINKITDEAVNCRNFYVHGSVGAFDYERNFDMVIFFTNTLDFVFAISDLIEAGWKAEIWLKQPTSMAHPFGRYKVAYSAYLAKLLTLLPTSG